MYCLLNCSRINFDTVFIHFALTMHLIDVFCVFGCFYFCFSSNFSFLMNNGTIEMNNIWMECVALLDFNSKPNLLTQSMNKIGKWIDIKWVSKRYRAVIISSFKFLNGGPADDCYLFLQSLEFNIQIVNGQTSISCKWRICQTILWPMKVKSSKEMEIIQKTTTTTKT